MCPSYTPEMIDEDQVVRHAAVGGRSVAWSSVGSGPVVVIGGWWSSHLGSTGRTRPSGASSGSSPAGIASSATTGPAPASPTAAARPATATRRWPCWPASSTPSAPTGCTCSAPPPGSPVAATYAADHPDRVDRLILYGGYARGADIAAPAAREPMVGLVETHWGLGSRVLADVFLPGATAREREAFARFQRRSASRDAAAAALRSVYALDATDRLAAVRAPTLVLHRRGDSAIPFALGRDLAERIPRARFVELSGDEHFPWRGDTASVAAAVELFLEGRDPAAGVRPPVVSGRAPAHGPRARGPPAGRRGPDRRRDRPGPGAQQPHGAPARGQHPHPARRTLTGRGRGLGRRERPALTRTSYEWSPGRPDA